MRGPVPIPCLCEMLRRATRQVTRAYDEALRPIGIRITQQPVLAHLASEGPCRVRDLGAALEMDETTVTRSVRVLLANGWISVRPGEDRRERIVALTSRGADVLRRALDAWRVAQERMRERLGERDWKLLMSALARVGPVMAAATGPDE